MKMNQSILSMAALGAFMGSGTALAQPTPIPNTPYVEETVDWDFEPLDNPTVVSQPSSGGVFSGLFEVPLPFQFAYYDDNVSVVSQNVNGAIAMRDGVNRFDFDADAWAPGGGPQFGTDVDGWIAPWWGDSFPVSQNNSSVSWQVDGQAPQRTITFQWANMAEVSSQFGCCDYDLSTQIVLYEGLSGRIDLRWTGTVSNIGGVSTFSDYTSAMESRQGDRGIEFITPACSPDCRPARCC